MSSKNKEAVSFKLNKNPTLQVKRALPVKSQEKLHHVSEKWVDMKKVKLDVMKPRIAQWVIELRRSEDEEIANYICGLLADKVVDRETIQRSIDKVMRDKTGSFMQKLWTHLVSAQENASGIPQQFLDAEEGTRKKQEDTDQITRELEDTEVTDEKNGSKETARSNAPQSYQFLSPKPSVSPPRKKRIFLSPGEFVKPYIIPRSKANPYQQRTPSPAPRSPSRSWSPLHKTSTRQRLPSPECRSSSRRRSSSWRSRSPAYVRRGLHSSGGRSPDQRRGQRDEKTRRGHEERRDTSQREDKTQGGREKEEEGTKGKEKIRHKEEGKRKKEGT